MDHNLSATYYRMWFILYYVKLVLFTNICDNIDHASIT